MHERCAVEKQLIGIQQLRSAVTEMECKQTVYSISTADVTNSAVIKLSRCTTLCAVTLNCSRIALCHLRQKNCHVYMVFCSRRNTNNINKSRYKNKCLIYATFYVIF